METAITDLFGAPLSSETEIRISFKGPTFDNGEIQIGTLYRELESLEKVLKRNISLLIESGKLDPSLKDIQILVQIEKGSVIQTLKIIFNKGVIGTFAVTTVSGLLVATYEHFLKMDEIKPNNPYRSELQKVANDGEYKNNLSNIVGPISQKDDTLVIQDNHGTINVITQAQKEQIVQNLQSTRPADPLLRNGEYEEHLNGVVRKLDLDANAGNYFGFTIDNGPAKIPTSIQGEFNLTDIRGIIDEHLSVIANVKYKDGAITHIEIISYSRLDKQDDLSL